MYNDSDKSYKRYVQYRHNRYRYEQEQITIPIAVMLIMGFITKYWRIILGIGLTIIFFILLYSLKKFITEVNAHREMVAKEIAGTILAKLEKENNLRLPPHTRQFIKIKIKEQILQLVKGPHIENFQFCTHLEIHRSSPDGCSPKYEIEEITTRILDETENKKYKCTENKKEEYNMTKPTQTGFINENQQKNNGRTEFEGTDYNQKLYSMECLKCGHHYYANGSDIHLRKCPNCMGGRP